MKIIKIGRSSSNDVNINDSSVSRSHCQIIQDDYGNFRLIDTNSANGTFVNGVKRHGEVKLNTSDIVRIGNTTLPWQTYFNNVGRTDYDVGRTIAPAVGGGNSNSNSNNIEIILNRQEEREQNFAAPASKPSSFLVWAILCTICCCQPFGIVSIVYSSKVDSLWYSGRYTEALDAATSARTWFWWGLATGILVEIPFIIYYIIVVVGLTLG